MIDYITGKVRELTPTHVILDNQGIGYCLEISLETYEALQGKSEATAYVQQQVNPREGITVDYGFATKSERDLFCKITSVSGIGAASARMILSSLSPAELEEAILSENVNLIKSVKGIGLKSAQRLVLELRDKIVKGSGGEAETLFVAEKSAIVEEATRALQILGFNKTNIDKAIQAILKKNPAAKVEEIIKDALKML